MPTHAAHTRFVRKNLSRVFESSSPPRQKKQSLPQNIMRHKTFCGLVIPDPIGAFLLLCRRYPKELRRRYQHRKLRQRSKAPMGSGDDEPTERLMPHDDFAEGSASSASVGKSPRRLYSDSYDKPCMSSMESGI